MNPHGLEKLGQRQSPAEEEEGEEEGAHVWFLFCDREQRRNWHLGELLGLSSICNKSSSISSPQPAHRLLEIALLDANGRTRPSFLGPASAPLALEPREDLLCGGGAASWGARPVPHAGHLSSLPNPLKPGDVPQHCPPCAETRRTTALPPSAVTCRAPGLGLCFTHNILTASYQVDLSAPADRWRS